MNPLAADALVPFLTTKESSPLFAQDSAGEVSLVYTGDHHVRIVGEGPDGPLSRVRPGEVELVLTDSDEFHGTGAGETAEICPADAGGQRWVRFVDASKTRSVLFPITEASSASKPGLSLYEQVVAAQRRRLQFPPPTSSSGPVSLRHAVAAYALADGTLLAIERSQSDHWLAHLQQSGHIERTQLPVLSYPAEFVGLASGFWFWTVAKGCVRELHAQRLGASGPEPAVLIGTITFPAPHTAPWYVHLRGQGDERFLAVGISNYGKEAQLATSFLSAGRWEPLQIHRLQSLSIQVQYQDGVGRVAWYDSDWHRRSTHDLFLLEARPGQAASILRQPGLPAAGSMGFQIALLGDQLLAVWLDGDTLRGRCGPLTMLGSLPDRVLVKLPPGQYWSFKLIVRSPYALVLLHESPAHNCYAIQIDEHGTACCARPA